MADDTATTHVTLVIVPRFPLLSLAMCTESLRVANRESLAPAFSWSIASVDGEPVASSSGIDITPSQSLDEIAVAPVILVLASYQPEQAYIPKLLNWLRRQDRRGSLIGCVDTGALILAKAGLLTNMAVSVHRESVDPMREAFGAEIVYDRLYAVSGRRLSSAGGVATFDMMLALIARFKGERLADRIADVLNHRRIGPAPRAGDPPAAIAAADPGLMRLVEVMQANLEEPLAIADICRAADLPDWRARRLFARYLGRSPAAYYRHLRLERARHLLSYGHAPIKQIALASGFADSAAFCNAFKAAYGARPSRYRRARTGAEIMPGPQGV